MEKLTSSFNKTSIVVISCLISIVVSLSSVLIYDRFFAQKIVVFDLKGFVEEQKNLFLKGMINNQDFKDNLDILEEYLKSVPKNKVVILGDTVVRFNAEILPPPPNIKRFSSGLLNSNNSSNITPDKSNER